MNLPGLKWGSPRYTTLVDNGPPDKRLDIALIGDGYTAGEQSLFNQDADVVVEGFRQAEPIATYFKHFNFHRINVISQESGTLDPHVDPRATPNTALKTFFSPIAERRLVGPDPWVMLVAKASGAPWDKILCIVNAPRRGGATLISMSIGYASRNSGDFPEILIHEAGHTIAGVIDEYTGDLPDIDFADGWSLPNFLPWPNVDTNLKRPKWWRWLTPGVEMPTPNTQANDDVVGAFQGAVYTGKGVYRPQRRCMMRRHQDPFCVVCSEQWIRAIYKRSPISDGFSPMFQRPEPPLVWQAGEPLTFQAQVVRGEDIKTVWRTKKLEQRRWRRRQISQDYRDFTTILEPNRLAGQVIPTAWAVECQLEDGSDRIRQPAVRRVARQSHRWYVIIRER